MIVIASLIVKSNIRKKQSAKRHNHTISEATQSAEGDTIIMIRLLLFVGIFLLAFANCQTETATEKEAKQQTRELIEAAQADSKVKLYDGIIHHRGLGTRGKDTIEVQLVTEEKKVSGFYINHNEGVLYPIKGAKRDNGTLELSAYDDTGGTIELFIGQKNENTIKGEWFNKQEDAGDEQSTFTFTEKQTEIAQEDLKSIQGTYEYTVQGYSSFIILEPIGNKTVKIQSVVTYGSCTGEINGEAYVYNNKLINFFGEDNCFLKLELGKNTINASEISCSFYHGHSCIFDGTYRKVSDDLNWIITG